MGFETLKDLCVVGYFALSQNNPAMFSNYLPIFDLFLRVSEVAPRRSWRDTL